MLTRYFVSRFAITKSAVELELLEEGHPAGRLVFQIRKNNTNANVNISASAPASPVVPSPSSPIVPY